MKYFDTRTSIIDAELAWPAKPPVIENFPLPAALYVPLTASRGSDPLVTRPVGTHVSAGDNLVESVTGAVALHPAPVDGTLGPACDVRLTNGRSAFAVTLHPDPQRALPDRPGPDAFTPKLKLAPNRSDLAEWIDRLSRAGLWIERQASPSLLAQLNMTMRRPVDTVLCSALDADPPVRLNAVILASRARAVVAGVQLLKQISGANIAKIVLDETTPRAWAIGLRAAARDADVQILAVPNDYPHNDPTLLIYAALGRRLRPGRSPVEQGVIVLDAAAANTVADAISGAIPGVDVAVRDLSTDTVQYRRVPIGLRAQVLFHNLWLNADLSVRRGDLLREQLVASDDVIGPGDIVFHLMSPASSPIPAPCTRCGWCIEACPVRIHPAGLLESAQRQSIPLAEQYGLEACIECGICSYVCPSNLPILPAIRSLLSHPPAHKARDTDAAER